MAASEHSQKNKAKGGFVRPDNRVLVEDDNSDSDNEDVVEIFPQSLVKVQDTSHPALLSSEPVLKPLESFSTLDLPHKRPIRPAVEKEKNDIDTIENVSQVPTKNDNLPCVDEAHKARSDMMSKLGLREEEDVESSWDSESISESLPQKYVDHLLATANQRAKSMLIGHVEGKNKKMINKISGLQKELSEAKETKSQLEHQNVELEQELCSLRFSLKQEEGERRNAEMLLEKIREQLRKTEEQCNKEVEVKEQLELNLRTRDMELRTMRNSLSQVVEERNETHRRLSQEYNVRILQEGLLTNQLSKQQELEMTHKKMNSEVVVRQLQQELADSLKKQSMSEASLEIVSHYCTNLEDEKKELKRKLQKVQDQHTEAVICNEKTQDHMQKLEIEIDKLNLTVQKQAHKIEQLKKNLLSTSSIDDLTVKLERAASKCQHLDAQNKVLQQKLLSMKEMKKKYVKLKKDKKQLEQEVVSLKSHIELNMVELGQLEQYKQEIEERARQDIVEKLKEVNLFLQVQAACQENLDQLRENNNTSLRREMGLRIKELESELKMKTSQEDVNKTELEKYKQQIKNLEHELIRMKSFQEECNKIELEKYKQLFLEGRKVRKSLATKLKILHRDNERLAEIISTKLLVEKQQSRTVLSTLTARPVLETPCMGNLTNSARLPRNLVPRESILFSSANPRPRDGSIETFLFQMQQELEKSINREVEEAAGQLESGSYRSPPGSIEAANLTQDLLWKTSREYVEILKKKYLI